MRIPRFIALLGGWLIASAGLAAQSQVSDVGLTFSPWPMLPVLFGQDCGPFSCLPMSSGPIGAASTGSITVYGAPNAPYALGISIAAGAGPCVSVLEIGNTLLLDPASTVTLAFGIVPPSSVPLACGNGYANVSLPVPYGTPTGLQFRLQAIATGGNSRQVAFTIAIDGSTG
jgi:hypothetical protein